MKMEHINENTIKVMIGHSDLEDRGITFFDLLGNQNQVESFFYEILEEVGVRHEFEGLDAVTFQVVPKNDGLDLYISKGMNTGLKDHLKHTFQSSPDALKNTPLDQVIQIFEKEEKQQKEKAKMSSKGRTSTEKYQVYVFEKFLDVVSFAQSVKTEKIYINHLYHFDDAYYWIHQLNHETNKQAIHYRAIEHGTVSVISPMIVKEHGQLIIENDAIHLMNTHFK
ncbi:adaptor protein MecA [Carnobacteriaceae bacterium zg-ZUI252]|nr:adaptor protein MecA [Carnobacteriaceae bacterium zg-ZUI252]MBS4770756.1 adaptor protein MecA [Carnobacteriaceae bacterium zg-ZUI240]QTU83473.1 adaptor protein MecA [Carnobacteriaceae bacterium zg-C25]